RALGPLDGSLDLGLSRIGGRGARPSRDARCGKTQRQYGCHQRDAHENHHTDLVMDRVLLRSEGVTETQTPAGPTAPQTSWERLEALYRSSRDDVYAYVATLLGDPAAAEDITALAF